MSYYAEVVLAEDMTNDLNVVNGDVTRYENLRRIERAAGNEWDHTEQVTFERMNGERFTETCVFLRSGRE